MSPESYGYYNANRRGTSVTNGRNKTRTYAYTNRGEVYTLTHADSEVETWALSTGNGDVSAYTNQLSQTINYGYDDASRTGIDYPSGTDVSFGYDNANRRTSMTDSTGTTDWTYNAASEITDLETPQGDLEYTYDSAGRRATMVEVGTGTTTYTYNAGSQLTDLENPFSEVTQWLYDDGGKSHQADLPLGRLHELRLRQPQPGYLDHPQEERQLDDLFRELRLRWHEQSKRQKTVNSVVTDYTYDDIDQSLLRAVAAIASYTFDANGIWATKTLNWKPTPITTTMRTS